MNKETKIAKENIEWKEQYRKVDNQLELFFKEKVCKEHKQTCQRWLEFIESIKTFRTHTNNIQKIIKKDNDLKQAIKLYGENGI